MSRNVWRRGRGPQPTWVVATRQILPIADIFRFAYIAVTAALVLVVAAPLVLQGSMGVAALHPRMPSSDVYDKLASAVASDARSVTFGPFATQHQGSKGSKSMPAIVLTADESTPAASPHSDIRTSVRFKRA